MVLNLADDPDSRVRFQAAFALGKNGDPRAVTALGQLVLRDAANPWIRAAVLSSCASIADSLLVELYPTRPATASEESGYSLVLKQLVEIVGARNRPNEVNRVLDVLAADARHPVDSGQFSFAERLVLQLARASRRSASQLALERDPARPGTNLVDRLIQRAGKIILDVQTSPAVREEAITMLGGVNPDQSQAVLIGLLTPQEPLTVQISAVRALGESSSAKLPDLLLPRLQAFEPPVRAAAVQTLLSRAEWAKAVLRAVRHNDRTSGRSAAIIEPSDRAPLLRHHDVEIARLAHAVFGESVLGLRSRSIMDYLPALRGQGNVNRGTAVFDRECKACHKVGDRGFTLGPDLTGSASADTTALLANILDPNANVSPKYVQYLVTDKNGRTYSGVIAAETATSLTLHRGGGARDTILRAQIAEITSTGVSLMPEGLEKSISKPEMADLVAFLRAQHRDGGSLEVGSATSQSQPLDIGTLPGLIEPDE
jgi:putative heme-binding domain-containing protein